MSTRTTRALAVVGACALGLSALPLAAAPASAAPAEGATRTRADAPPAVGDTAYVDVAVATLWSSPGLERAMDRPSLANPVDLRAWNLAMQATPDREWLSEGRLETQALLGQKVTVTDVDGDWAKVVVAGQATPRDARGYPGWVPAAQLTGNDRYGQRLAETPRAVVTARTTWLAKGPAMTNATTEISFDTQLPVVGSRPGVVEVSLPNGRTGWLDAHDVDIRRPGQSVPRPTGQDIVETGSRFLGLRYLWAGTSAFGFDCSGFTLRVFHAHGIDIPRDSGPQSQGGTPVARERLRPGDLVFFAGPGGVGRVHHVAIYAGGGKILHSPNSARNVEVVDLKRFDVDDEYAGARRYL